ncbi:MAG: LbtU family siderophore porin [Gammaproteobacteria bacterium]|nr:LbtU family siderophore porin [Gammaproteobacteria bacterium]
MKLKHVVVSMCVLGLISSPVLASTKNKHHKKQETQTQENYKGEAYKGELAAPVMCPKTDIYTMTLDAMSQNIGRAKPTVGCDNPLSFAGGINFDAHWFNRHNGYAGENTRRFALNDAYLNLYGNVNEWVQAFASLSYSGFNSVAETGDNYLPGTYSNSYRADALTLEQGFITFRNMNWSPLFVRVGKEFTDFGRYEIHPMVRSFTQVLSESLHTQAQLGFLTPMGLYGSVYTFNNDLAQGTGGHPQNNYGGNIGFGQPNDQFGYDLGIGYLYDFTGVDDVAYAVGTFNGTGQYGNYAGDRVGAISLYGRLNTGPFFFGANYVTALDNFSSLALPENNNSLTSGAKPWAANAKVGYGFNVWGKNQGISLGYEHSGDSQYIFLPESRWLVGYDVEVLPRTTLGLEYTYDIAYDEAGGATTSTATFINDNASTLTLRAAVQFG